MQVCTIVARNYLAAARVLARSFREHHPDGTCWVLVIDDLTGEVTGDGEPFVLVRPDELGIARWDEMTAGYSVLELSTAVKPWLLRHLMYERGAERVLYLDPDIQVFAPLTEVEDLLGAHALVVNPHLTAAMPRDGHRPSETDILVSGSFNLGFAGFAVGAEVDELLSWWAERLSTDCLVAPERGYFVDQRWMDLAPGLVPSLYVLRDPGYNLAYWNLAGRAVTRDAHGVSVDGRPLRFFHFSGYDPDRPDQLSKHQDRVELERQPVVRALCDGYARALWAAGHADWRRRSYGFAALPDGTPLDAASRGVYRQAVLDGALADERIFTPSGGHAFLEYLRGPAAHGAEHGVTRYLEALRESRTDLRQAFPSLAGADGARLAAWSSLEASGIPPALRADPLALPPPAVNVAGYLQGVMGVGEHARQLVAALRSQHVPVTTVTLRPDAAPEDPNLAEERETGPDQDAYFNLLCVNADSVAAVARQLGDRFFSGRYSFGFWAWEVEDFPDAYHGAFAYLDEVWVGSRHVQAAISPHAEIPVHVIPQPVSLPPDIAEASPPPGLPEGFRFLFAFDYLSVFERKNPLATLEAFRRAFAPGAGSVLIVKTINSGHDPEAHARLLAAASSHPDIHVLEGRLSASERNGLLASADCYVSLHRAEGFGYTMAESMWAGIPVIATGYSGNLDYMTPENSHLVNHTLVRIGPGGAPYPETGVWAEPDIEHAAQLMREVRDDPAGAAARADRGAREIRASHGPEAAGRAMADRLASVMGSEAWRSARRGGGRPGPLDLDWVSHLVRSGPVPSPARPRFGALQTHARRGLLRALKPIAVHERLINGELLNAIERLDANLRSAIRDQAAMRRRIEELETELRVHRGRDRSD